MVAMVDALVLVADVVVEVVFVLMVVVMVVWVVAVLAAMWTPSRLCRPKLRRPAMSNQALTSKRYDNALTIAPSA